MILLELPQKTLMDEVGVLQAEVSAKRSGLLGNSGLIKVARLEGAITALKWVMGHHAKSLLEEFTK